MADSSTPTYTGPNILVLSLLGWRRQFRLHCVAAVLITLGWAMLFWFNGLVALGLVLLLWGYQVQQKA